MDNFDISEQNELEKISDYPLRYVTKKDQYEVTVCLIPDDNMPKLTIEIVD